MCYVTDPKYHEATDSCISVLLIATKEPVALQTVYFQMIEMNKRMEALETEVRTIAKVLEKRDINATASSVTFDECT